MKSCAVKQAISINSQDNGIVSVSSLKELNLEMGSPRAQVNTYMVSNRTERFSATNSRIQSSTVTGDKKQD